MQQLVLQLPRRLSQSRLHLPKLKIHNREVDTWQVTTLLQTVKLKVEVLRKAPPKEAVTPNSISNSYQSHP